MNSFSNDYSWVKIRVRTIEISWKSCKAHQLTSRCHNFLFDHWISKFFSFLETTHPDLSRDTKINPIQAWEGLHQELKGHFLPINTPRPSLDKKEKEKEIGLFGAFFGQILSLFLSKFSPKHINNLWFLSSLNNQEVVF